MTGWSLGIDLGTSYTVAAVASADAVTVVDVEASGQHRIPSSVYLTEEGDLLVGTAAKHQSVFAPERFEPTPKRSFGEGELFLGDRLLPVADLAAAVLRRVYTEATRQQGETAPDEIRLTHPAEWGEARLGVLREAAERAGLGDVALVPEPVSAAVRIAYRATAPDQLIAVYDFGGGTFDAAVLLRTDEGFEIAGPPAGRDPLGGEDIDERIISYLGGFLAEDHPEEWQRLRDPPDVAWRRDAIEFRAEVQQAKETLSEVAASQLWVPGLDREVQLTRTELEQLIGDDVEATIDTLESALHDAAVTVEDLAGVYMVGGSSRIPLVASTLWRRLGVRPAVHENPKSVVAMGAAAWLTGASRQPAMAAGDAAGLQVGGAEPPETSDLPVGAGTAGIGAVFRTRLAMSLEPEVWPAGCECTAQLVLDYLANRPLTLRARDEPARDLDSEGLAKRVLAMRAARTPSFAERSVGPAEVFGAAGGVERQFQMKAAGTDIAMLERYLVVGGRALVIACPEAARSLADSLELRDTESERDWFHPRFHLELPAQWTATEELTLRRIGTEHAVTTRRALLWPRDASAWHDEQVGDVQRLPGAQLVQRRAATVLNQFAGEVMTFLWNDGLPRVTKLGVADNGGEGYSMLITLPHAEQAMFAQLARHVRIQAPSPVAVG
jgi:actin-like ATPase involved in cell morphogenesis